MSGTTKFTYYSVNNYGGHPSTTEYSFNVSNLSFSPSIVVAYEIDCNRNYNPYSIYIRDAKNSAGDSMIPAYDANIVDYNIEDYFVNGFNLPVKYSNMNMQWIAYE